MATYIVKHRRATRASLSNKYDLVPLEGELIVEFDEANSLHRLKIGDGIHSYPELSYLMAGDEVLTQALPNIIEITLNKDKWVEDGENPVYYYQEVAIEDASKNSRLDLQPDIDMLAEFQKLGLVFTTKNVDGVISVCSVGNKPVETYTMQATLIAADVISDCDKVLGIPIGSASGTSASLEETNARVTELEEQMAELRYVPIAIESFKHNHSTKERGQKITSVTLSWSINKDPLTLTICDTSTLKEIDVTLSKTGSVTINDLSVTWDNLKEWKLTTTDEKNKPISKETPSFVFYNRVYYGALEDGVLDDSDDNVRSAILGLSSSLRADKNITFNVSTDKPMWPTFVIPSRYVAPTKFNIGGLDYAWNKVKKNFKFKNAHDYVEDYDVWQHTRMITGDMTVTVV